MSFEPVSIALNGLFEGEYTEDGIPVNLPEISVWPVRDVSDEEDGHPSGIAVFIEGRGRTLEFVIPADDLFLALSTAHEDVVSDLKEARRSKEPSTGCGCR